MSKITLSFFLLLTVCCSNILTANGDCISLEKTFSIKVFYSTNVLEATRDSVTVQVPSDADEQQWQFVPSARLGTFNILSKSTGRALDVVEDSGRYNATLGNLEDSVYQQWFINSDWTIVNAGLTDFALDIPGSDYSEGNYVQLANRYDDDNFDNEKFILQYR